MMTSAKSIIKLSDEELKDSKLNAFLHLSQIDKILQYGELVEFTPGEIIVRQGKLSEGMYIILTGEVDIAARILGEGNSKLDTVGPGAFLGDISFIEQTPSPTTATATGKVKCLYISLMLYELLTGYFPDLKYNLLREISVQVCGRLKKMHDKVTDIINNSNMTTISLLGRVIHTLTQPKQSLKDPKELNIEDLKKKGFFQLFSHDEISELFKHTVLLEAARNCILIHEHEITPECYIVIQGAVQSSIMEQNKQAKLSVIGPGSLFASVACVDYESDFTITFIACESATLLKISNEALTFFEKNRPEIWYKLFTLICGSILALGRSINKLDVRLNIEIYNR
jgi:CRP/FNR family cyclic AMP-dependent transcriptional regulator